VLVSIIISERGEPHNLVWTLQGLEEELQGVEREYIIVTNGEAPDDPIYKWIEKKWPCIDGYCHFYHQDEGSIYKARNLGAGKANGKYLWFLDAHTLPVPGHYQAALDFKKGWTGILHMGMKYFLDKYNRVVYGYRWNREKFWGAWTRTPPIPPDYRILMNGGANLLIDKVVWDEIDGYNPGLGIYGGGEPYTDLKAQMYGHHVKSHPDLHYYHLATNRGYNWNQDDMWRNFMITAYALGGDKYLDIVYGTYKEKCGEVKRYLENLNALRDEAVLLAQADRDKIEATAIYSVDDVLESWYEYVKEQKISQ